jgi:hypothetical protein
MVITHFLNIVWMVLLARCGVEVLSACPKLHWRDDCRPGREWPRFSRKRFPAGNGRWTSLQEEESWSPVLALPGRRHLGLGRHWNLLTVQLWIVTGLGAARRTGAAALRDPTRIQDVKRIHEFQLSSDYRQIGQGQGGWREDHQYYSADAGI